MKRFATTTTRTSCLALGLCLSLSAADARAGSILPALGSAAAHGGAVLKHYVEVEPGIFIAVKGARERRQVRFARLVESWSPDQRAVAAEHGFPVMRWRDLTAGVLTLVWSYPERDRQFVFDDAGRLIETRIR